jgi:hypothetical protein
VTYSSTASWTVIDLPVLEQIKRSTDLRELSRSKWPSWTHGSTQFNRILGYATCANAGSTLPTTGIVATLLVERIDPKDAPKVMNYNFHLIAESTDGRIFQSPPIRPTDPKHHSSAPSTWFDNLGSPL